MLEVGGDVGVQTDHSQCHCILAGRRHHLLQTRPSNLYSGLVLHASSPKSGAMCSTDFQEFP